jgi:hypothetical protein
MSASGTDATYVSGGYQLPVSKLRIATEGFEMNGNLLNCTALIA